MDKEKLDGLTMDVEAVEHDKLKSIFPQCFTDGKLDIDMLLNLCGEYITNDFEKYKFEWKGKIECFQIAGKRSLGTLRPCVEESVNFDTTQNFYIEGDNLEVLKLLQSSYFGKVKMIYIEIIMPSLIQFKVSSISPFWGCAKLKRGVQAVLRLFYCGFYALAVWRFGEVAGYFDILYIHSHEPFAVKTC